MTKPTYVVGENVTGIIGLALDTVLSDLEAQDYTQKRLLFQLAVKTHGTGEIGSGLWLTPTASDGKMSKKKTENLYVTENGTIRLRNKAGNSSNAGLANQVLFFPTPQHRDFRSGEAKRWLDPNRSRNLNDAIAFFPTPTTQDAKNNGSQSQMERNSLPLNAVAGGKLNPEWVEKLMGFPPGWTEI